jgi:hypothetical protein
VGRKDILKEAVKIFGILKNIADVWACCGGKKEDTLLVFVS